MGATPTASLPGDKVKAITEIHPGNYIFYGTPFLVYVRGDVWEVTPFLVYVRGVYGKSHRSQFML